MHLLNRCAPPGCCQRRHDANAAPDPFPRAPASRAPSPERRRSLSPGVERFDGTTKKWDDSPRINGAIQDLYRRGVIAATHELSAECLEAIKGPRPAGCLPLHVPCHGGARPFVFWSPTAVQRTAVRCAMYWSMHSLQCY